jgi:hypothetical protein
MSTSKPASSVWTRTRRRTTRAARFPFTDALERLLEAQRPEHEQLKAEGVICPWVFNRSNRKVKGKRITTFIKAFRSACTKAGCPGRIPHDLRRTAVRNLVRAGVPGRVAMQMTGHKTRSVFERYHRVSECDLVEAAKKLTALQPDSLPPEGASHTSDRDGHNSGTVKPDRGPRLKVSLQISSEILVALTGFEPWMEFLQSGSAITMWLSLVAFWSALIRVLPRFRRVLFPSCSHVGMSVNTNICLKVSRSRIRAPDAQLRHSIGASVV